MHLISGDHPHAGGSPNDGFWMGSAGLRPLDSLGTAGKVTLIQAERLRAPMADDIAVEVAFGGYMDNRPLVCMLPAIHRILAKGKDNGGESEDCYLVGLKGLCYDSLLQGGLTG